MRERQQGEPLAEYARRLEAEVKRLLFVEEEVEWKTADLARLREDKEQLQRENKALDGFLVERTAERDRLREKVAFLRRVILDRTEQRRKDGAELARLREALNQWRRFWGMMSSEAIKSLPDHARRGFKDAARATADALKETT